MMTPERYILGVSCGVIILVLLMALVLRVILWVTKPGDDR